MKRERLYTLRPLMSQVIVHSNANGTLTVEPRWRKKIGKPGLMARLAAANRLAYLLNSYLKRRKLP
jgi:hypothetical protein